MSWKQYDDSGQRWTWPGEERHLLVLVDGQLREYVENPGGLPTVHVYVPNPHVLVHADPLDGATHYDTCETEAEHAPWVRALDDRELFEWIMAERYYPPDGLD